MLKIVGKKIFLTRGDTAYITVNIFAPDGSAYKFQEGDKVWFAAKRKTTDADYLISPRELTLEPEAKLWHPQTPYKAGDKVYVVNDENRITGGLESTVDHISGMNYQEDFDAGRWKIIDLSWHAILHIAPTDTETLAFGSYFYDISLVNDSTNFVNTIIEPSSFTILEEVGSSRDRGRGR